MIDKFFLSYHFQSLDDEDSECSQVFCNAKAFQQEIKVQHDVYVAILRAVSVEKLNDLFGEDHPSYVMKIKRDDLPKEIWKICEEYAAVFPKDLPQGVPLKRMGMNLKLI